METIVSGVMGRGASPRTCALAHLRSPLASELCKPKAGEARSVGLRRCVRASVRQYARTPVRPYALTHGLGWAGRRVSRPRPRHNRRLMRMILSLCGLVLGLLLVGKLAGSAWQSVAGPPQTDAAASSAAEQGAAKVQSALEQGAARRASDAASR